ncbi:hypothetical protein ACH5RR_006476 [Cinchona calisaya]|uniref:Pectinesterase inhibitor domain-containing protein n=1 Tax=Cinchona calisaya TaxID=153742 RepID=A0ABD3AP43_9GENT
MATLVRVGIFAMSCILMATHYLQIADADESLINNLCSNTLEPGYCKCCFQSIPGSNQQDARGLGGSSIKCAAKQSIIVQLDFRELASNCTDGEVEKTYDTCVDRIVAARHFFGDAYLTWEEGRYSDAAELAQAALENYWQCVHQLEGSSMTPKLITDCVYLRAFSEVAVGILHQL